MRPRTICRCALPFLASLACLTSGARAHAMPSYVACIGDSITQGYAASTPSLDWVSDLATLLGTSVTVANYGVASTTMMKESNFPYWTNGDLPAAESFVTDAGASANVAVILMLGTNDSKDNPGGVYNWDSTAPTRYAADYNSMIDLLQALTPEPQIFLALPPPAFQNADSIDDAVLEFQIIPIILGIGQTRQLPVIDVRTPLEGMAGLFVDGVHPDDQGHMIIAQAMYGGLESPTIPSSDAGVSEGGSGSDASASIDASSPTDGATALDAMAPVDASTGASTDGATGFDASASNEGGGGSSGDGSVSAPPEGASRGCNCSAANRSTTVPRGGWTFPALVALLFARRRRAPLANCRSRAPPYRCAR
jgi:acyl-CoA thioesterase I